MRRAAVVAAVVAVVGGGAGCPDPCVWLGNGCNENDDCGSGEVCRLSRAFEYQCPVVKGTCVEPAVEERGCGSVDDCNEGECCDPVTNTCVGDAGYRSTKCDENTCGDCDESTFGEYCVDEEDCSSDETCRVESFVFDEETRGVCRPRCNSDDDCPAIARCDNSGCTVPIGTPCRVPDDEEEADLDECVGLECTDREAGDERTAEPYCTGFCSTVKGFEVCPAGFICEDATLRCRRLN